MESVFVDVVPKELIGHFEPTSPFFVHLVSNEMRNYHNTKNKDHDLVVSNLKRMRFRHVVIQEALLDRFIVAVVEAFNPVQMALTKTMRKKKFDEKLKGSFDRFFCPFQATVRLHRVSPEFEPKGNWPQSLTFCELALYLAELKSRFGNEVSLKKDISSLEALYVLVVQDGLEELWQRFVDLGLIFTDADVSSYLAIKADPMKFLSQWAKITDLVKDRHAESHSITVSIKYDLEKAKKKFITMEGAVEAEWAQSFKEVFQFCLIHCKYLLEKVTVESQKKHQSYEDEFAMFKID